MEDEVSIVVTDGEPIDLVKKLVDSAELVNTDSDKVKGLHAAARAVREGLEKRGLLA